jgi:hypothetical protein
LTLVATPSGGQFSGQGVNSNKFKTATILPGVYSVYYTLPNIGGCKYSAMQTMTVNAVPLVSFVGSPYIKCNTDTLIISGNPTGGTISYSGSGLSGSTFYCSVAGIGTHPISYSYTGTNGCSNSTTTNIQVNSCVGIHEIDNLNSLISIYPNPANDKLNIKINKFNNTNQYKFKLVSVEGKELKSESLINSQTEIDVSDLSNGIYFLEVNTANSNLRKKLIIT